VKRICGADRVARTPPNYIHANHSEIAARAAAKLSKSLRLRDNLVLTRVSSLAVRNTMKTVGIERKKAVLVGLQSHVRLKILRNEQGRRKSSRVETH
jgi:hypothetical protein